jgi:hypothetical protein
VSLTIIGLVVTIPTMIMMRRSQRPERAEISERNEARLEDWRRAVQAWERSYYCYRDDVVWDPAQDERFLSQPRRPVSPGSGGRRAAEKEPVEPTQGNQRTGGPDVVSEVAAQCLRVHLVPVGTADAVRVHFANLGETCEAQVRIVSNAEAADMAVQVVARTETADLLVRRVT